MRLTRRYIDHSRPAIEPGDIEAVAHQLESGQLAAGPVARSFEEDLAGRMATSAEHVLATASGTFALYVALALVGVRAGDRVVLPTYACRALADAVAALGAAPLVLDVGPDYALTSEAAQAVDREARVAAIVVVHPFGRLVPLEPFVELERPVVEDCAQALPFGVDSIADASVFSFQATKLLASGEGGAVVASGARARERLAAGRRHASLHALPMVVPMSDLAAALGRRQLLRVEQLLDRRRQLAIRYDELLPVTLERLRLGERETPFRYVLRLDQPFERLREEMDRAGVAIRRPVDPLLHQALDLPRQSYPIAESLFARTVSLPLYPELSTEDVEHIARVLLRALDHVG